MLANDCKALKADSHPPVTSLVATNDHTARPFTYIKKQIPFHLHLNIRDTQRTQNSTEGSWLGHRDAGPGAPPASPGVHQQELQLEAIQTDEDCIQTHYGMLVSQTMASSLLSHPHTEWLQIHTWGGCNKFT